MLELRRIRKVYTGMAVVEEVSFAARTGEITGYLGAEWVRQVDHDEDCDWAY